MDNVMRFKDGPPLPFKVTIHSDRNKYDYNPAHYELEQWMNIEIDALKAHGITPIEWTDHGEYTAYVTEEWPGTHEFDGPDGWHWIIGIEVK